MEKGQTSGDWFLANNSHLSRPAARKIKGQHPGEALPPYGEARPLVTSRRPGAPGKVVRVTNRNIAGVGLWFCRLPKPITYLSTSQGHWLPLALRSLTLLAVALVSTIRAVAPFWTDGGMVKTRQHKRPGSGCKSWPLFTCGTHPIGEQKGVKSAPMSAISSNSMILA